MDASSTQKVAKALLWVITICTGIAALYVASKVALTLFGVLFAFADAAGAPGASGGGFLLALPEFGALFFSFLWGIGAPAIELLCIFGAGLLISYFLYKKKLYLFSIVASVIFLIGGFPFAHAQLYLAGENTTLPPTANSLTYKALMEPALWGGGVQPSRYGVDNANVYCNNTVLTGADSKTFALLAQNGDVSTYDYAKDYQHVYYGCNIVSRADPSTFTFIGNGVEYAKDATHVYSDGILVQGADAATFSISADGTVTKDKNYVYLDGSILKGADPQTYKVVGAGYGEDKNTVFDLMKGAAISGSDPSTFVVVQTLGNPPPSCGTNCMYDAKDKNFLYWRGAVVAKASQ